MKEESIIQLINGKGMAEQIQAALYEENKNSGLIPGLAMITVGDDPATASYIRLKERAVESIGGTVRTVNLPRQATRESLLQEIDQLNADPEVHGILLQLPLPEHLAADQDTFLARIHPEKDVDGFSPYNRGLLLGSTLEGFVSCAALACMEVCSRYAAPLAGKKALLVGDSFDVIQALALLLIQAGCLVHIEPEYHEESLRQADLAVIEKGTPRMVKGLADSQLTLLIDAGFHWVDNRSVGNVDLESTAVMDGYLLPVPGGMGPLLIAKLMENLCKAARQ
jgi:methylenetetrahydrofolate dehydrogenase (NADP+)/methenyltetrahydrofolate cyclohydrolase